MVTIISESNLNQACKTCEFRSYFLPFLHSSWGAHLTCLAPKKNNTKKLLQWCRSSARAAIWGELGTEGRGECGSAQLILRCLLVTATGFRALIPTLSENLFWIWWKKVWGQVQIYSRWKCILIYINIYKTYVYIQMNNRRQVCLERVRCRSLI